MAEQIENVPGFATLDPDILASVREDLGVDNLLEETPTESARPKRRRRGRPRKWARDSEGKPIVGVPVDQESSDQERPLETLKPNPLTTRDSKEIAARLQSILQGGSELAAVFNPAFQMQGKEAENIAKPLTSYIIRQEATSAIAQRVINDYDIAAFVIATLAYMVRVIKDIQNERATISEQQIAEGRRTSRGLERVPTSGRAIEPETSEIVPEVSGQNGVGPEGQDNLVGPFDAANLQGPPGNI